MAENESPSDGWKQRIKGIAAGLLTLEINTIEKDNMSGSKMPDLPLALHQIVDHYSSKLRNLGIPVTKDLLDLAQAHLNGATEDTLNNLRSWEPSDPNAVISPDITNGPKTFEALQWAADVAWNRLGPDGSRPATTEDRIERTLLARIRTNSRELRQVTICLLKEFASSPDARVQFDGTLDETLEVMFRHPRPYLQIDTDMLMLVRKIWDIGLERVLFQTVMQIDGDVLMRVSPEMDPVKRDFFAELHRSTVETGIRQWRGLFDLATSLISGAGELFR
jgi:hypothetical protein